MPTTPRFQVLVEANLGAYFLLSTNLIKISIPFRIGLVLSRECLLNQTRFFTSCGK